MLMSPCVSVLWTFALVNGFVFPPIAICVSVTDFVSVNGFILPLPAFSCANSL